MASFIHILTYDENIAMIQTEIIRKENDYVLENDKSSTEKRLHLSPLGG